MMELEHAKLLGERLRGALAPYCRRIEVAGSVRRGKAQVKDLELVAIPIIESIHQPVLFGQERVIERNLLDDYLQRQRPTSWDWDYALRRNGPLYKRLRHLESGLCCDLFMANSKNWGGALLVRTGPGDFSQAIVTRALKMGMSVSGGYYLHNHPPPGSEDGPRLPCDYGDKCERIIPTPEEQDFFEALELPWIPPGERNAQEIWRARIGEDFR